MDNNEGLSYRFAPSLYYTDIQSLTALLIADRSSSGFDEHTSVRNTTGPHRQQRSQLLTLHQGKNAQNHSQGAGQH